jgi:hypothetical protein
MNSTLVKNLTVIIGVAACFCTLTATLSASPPEKYYNGVVPIDSKPLGKSYGEWAAEWWKWGLGIPGTGPNATSSPYNPLLGGPCEVGQSGKVWFLAGVMGSTTGTVYRTCTVPKDTSLFFPLINGFAGAFLNDYPENRLLAYIRTGATWCKDGGPVTFVEVKIDGNDVKNPNQYYEQSPFFEFQLPLDNIFGTVNTLDPTPMTDPNAPNNVAYKMWVSPTADSGYYLFLNPLKPGSHTIEWNVTAPCGTGDIQQNIHYDITVPHH